MTAEVLTLAENPALFLGSMMWKISMVFTVMLIIVAWATYAERKIIGHMQTRVGPTMTGPKGLLQPIADGLKLFFKEDIVPNQATAVAFVLAPFMIIVPAFVTLAVIPFGNDIVFQGYRIPLQIAELNIGILYVLALAGLGVYGIVLAGWASNNKYSLLGGIRSSAQMISYELAAGLAIIAIFMLAETLSLRGIVEAQQASHPVLPFLPNWYIFSQPLAFVLFLIAGQAEINRIPFDLPEAETELVSGFCTEYSSMKYALFFMAEYSNMVVFSALISTLFLGGPAGIFPGPINLLIKIFAFMFFFIWCRATFPRVRYDQLMFIGWKVFLPLAILNILVTGAVLVM